MHLLFLQKKKVDLSNILNIAKMEKIISKKNFLTKKKKFKMSRLSHIVI